VAIIRYTAGLDAKSFERNPLVSDAVERCLQRISEAAAKLGDKAPTLIPDQPWHKIRSFGNVLRHDYDETGRLSREISLRYCALARLPLRSFEIQSAEGAPAARQ
jgi:hypothetical protein